MNGHKLIPLVIDDQTSPSEVVTGVQSSVVQGSIRHRIGQPALFLAAKYPQEQGVPVTGSYTDGPEWGEQPYTNMFSSDLGSVDPSYPVNTLEGRDSQGIRWHRARILWLRHLPELRRERRGAERSSRSSTKGASWVFSTRPVPFGGVNFTSEALEAKQQHVNALFPTMIDASDFALATALVQAGVKLKSAVFATGYAPDVIKSPSWSYLQGDEFLSIFRPFSLPRRRDRPDGGRAPEVRTLLENPVPDACSSTRPGRVPT